MHAAIAEHHDRIAALCRQFGVTRLEAFGSAARAADFDPAKSDVDFLVRFAPRAGLSPLRQYFGFAEALEGLLGRPVDLIDGEIRNPYVRASVERDRELVFAT
jgi:predicted nucleotidyltransferase